MAQTIQESIEELHGSLREYIEATYHISSPALIKQRAALLNRPEIIFQVPFIESTPRYKTGDRFSQINGLPKAALEIFTALSSAKGSLEQILHDPPYTHQSESIRRSLVEGKNLLIMTGTGSGKTESFLLPILGKLAREAQERPKSFRDQSAMRALVLYPMNALVNDQLGRMRGSFGDPRVVSLFKKWADRPARFARYTSRTPYAGVRTRKSDQRKLKPFEEYYVDIQRKAQGTSSEEQEEAQRLLTELKKRGKWPAKPDLVAWYGEKNTEWQDRKTGEFLRAVTLADDVELITRGEVQAAPPDLLVTNYSMLEYMLMRPIERTIFDRTKEWLAENKSERFLIVLDEAHLYRGAAGAEVSLLLRRLRDRLDIPPERFQVICATASFRDPVYAPKFGAQLAGVSADNFVAIQGDFAWREPAAGGTEADAKLLASLDLEAFHNAESDKTRTELIQPLLAHRKIAATGNIEADLYHALEKFPPLNLLVNSTMKQARPVKELGGDLFPNAPKYADLAATALMHLSSMARTDPKSPGLLPCRIHNFFRGLPGLWACMDPECAAIPKEERNPICGKMYGQPIRVCECNARVHELFTCRFCGTAYARAYSDDVDSPSALWSEPGNRLRMDGGDTSPLLPLDILLEAPTPGRPVEPATYDLETGRLNPNSQSTRSRTVFLRHDRTTPQTTDEEGDVDDSIEARGQFIPCACCGKRTARGSSSVQDHQTKGDEPFQTLVSRQIQIQPPGPAKATRFAPLRGRKVLVFSDSRQVAARLAPNLQKYSTRDSLRPTIVWGFERLQQSVMLKDLIGLDHLFLAVLLGSQKFGVRLRPELVTGENFTAQGIVEAAFADGSAETDAGLLKLVLQAHSNPSPQSLFGDIIFTVQDPFLGFEALAFGSLRERGELTPKLAALPPIPGLAQTTDEKVALARAWLRCWRNLGFWLNGMPQTWRNRPKREGVSVKDKKGKGKFAAMDTVIVDKAARKLFNEKWTPELLAIFTENLGGAYQLRGGQLSLQFEGPWARCETCKSVHRPVPNVPHCLDCGSAQVKALEPDTDPGFVARKGYYRKPVLATRMQPPKEPMALIAAEHTAQLNAPQNEDVFSKAEENELLFQDVLPTMGRTAQGATAIDVLSSTTTMEVGIDIGALSGVALRNMPPGRANYQQRSGRAGRRGNAVATVVAFGSADSHDEHYFAEPKEMISGDVIDPRLTLDNKEITRRHIRAFLLQNYHQDRLPDIDPEQPLTLFSVLGKVSDFRSGTAILNLQDFKKWLAENEKGLQGRIKNWIPVELSKEDRDSLLEEMKDDCVEKITEAVKRDETGDEQTSDADESPDEQAPEEGDEVSKRKPETGELLQRLLYCGILPRYAFPTDVATFSVFDEARSTTFRPIMRFAPSQGLPIALSQYAPGKQIWISGKCYVSGAIYSVMSEDRFKAWKDRRLYRECSACGFAKTDEMGTGVERGDKSDCPACGEKDSFGEARYWLRPPGFAHPTDVPEVTSPDDMPETSYATRAKLTMKPADGASWTTINDRVQSLKLREHLLVSNTGPKRDGYTYCVKCGRIEATTEQTPLLFSTHRKPFPDTKKPMCDGGPTQHLVLGTDFITDVALFSFDVGDRLRLRPGHYVTDVALRTVSEAVAKAGSKLLDIEPGELMAEYRPSLTPEGQLGRKAEVFLYDTLPGGAGFAPQLLEHGTDLLRVAREVMTSCRENCDGSCYRCLRSFKNKFEHSLLDRHVGIELLDYLLSGKIPAFNAARVQTSTALLANDLRRQGGNYEQDVDVIAGGKTISAPILATRSDGKKFVIALSSPLVGGRPIDSRLSDIGKDVKGPSLIVINELLVRSNLPAATREVLQGVAL